MKSKIAFAPLEKKTFEAAVSQVLSEEYGIQGSTNLTMMAKRIKEISEAYYKPKDHVTPGSLLWIGIDKDNPGAHNQGMEKLHQKPVVLSVVNKDDISKMLQKTKSKELRKGMAVRLFNEAYQQDAVLASTDVAAILHVSPATVANYVRQYVKETNNTVPTRGFIHDLGPTITHKVAIIKDYLSAMQNPDVARKHSHSQQATDRYINDYERVKLAQLKSLSIEEISRVTGLSRRLVKEYVNLFTVFEQNTGSNKGQGNG